nr:MAG TPA: hypothetical protein [Caudoviricetes sp.]
MRTSLSYRERLYNFLPYANAHRRLTTSKFHPSFR